MRILFVVSGNHSSISPITKNQGDSLVIYGKENSEPIDVDYYLIKGNGLKGYLKNIRPLRRCINKGNFEVVHAHFSLSAYVASLAGVRNLVVSLMGSDVKASKLYKSIIRLFDFFFRWKAVIVKSDDMYRNLGIKHAMVVPNGVDFRRFVAMEQRQCQQQLGWNVDTRHVLFPSNPERPEKDWTLAKQALSGCVNAELHPMVNVPNDTTPLYYNAADVVLLTSKWEGSPNAIKEALACGRPIVSTAVGDVIERTEGVSGCYVAQSREPEELSELLRQALCFQGETNGREKLRRDGLDNLSIARRLIEIYSKCISCE